MGNISVLNTIQMMKFLSCGLVESEVTIDAADYHNLTYFTGAMTL